jgi:Na+/alanine symporter
MHSRLHVPRRRSAPKATATADVSHLVEQGLVQSLGVFIDTLVICSATAFVILFDRSCTFRTREAREEAVAPTAFSWPTQVGTTPELMFRVRLDPGAATTVRVIASRNEAADGSKEVEFEM